MGSGGVCGVCMCAVVWCVCSYAVCVWWCVYAVCMCVVYIVMCACVCGLGVEVHVVCVCRMCGVLWV